MGRQFIPPIQGPWREIGVSVPNIGPVATSESANIVAQKAEALDYSLWTAEKLLWPVKPQAP